VRGRRAASSHPEIDEEDGSATVSREPEDLDPTGDSAVGAPQDGAGPASEIPAGLTWPQRVMHRLVLLDSWSPASYHLTSLWAARSSVRAEWTRSGDLTDSEAAALLTLDEATPWQEPDQRHP
jgi:hypothetical protein